jgi:hypothetical protein
MFDLEQLPINMHTFKVICLISLPPRYLRQYENNQASVDTH